MKLPNSETLKEIYGEAGDNQERFKLLAESYKKHFHSEQMVFFSSPGRTEILGNHTDHNGGKVIAASINMDTIGAAYPNDSRNIVIISEGYNEQIVIDVDKVDDISKENGTVSLVAGMIKAIQQFGYKISGFQAYISTEVISSAGVSSSASFEMLFCTIVNYFFNNKKINCVELAKLGQYAENHFWNKASGLMDQLACAVGGTILLDFSSKTLYEKVDFNMDDFGYRMIIVNTGRGHADLSDEYSLIPEEMKLVAKHMGAEKLSERNLDDLFDNMHNIEKKVINDRAILRTIHFYEENARVDQAMDAIYEGEIETFIKILTESGKSSWEYLQNCYSLENYKEQKITLYLALTELFLRKKKKGCCRVHGGGFAGVIMSIVSEKDEDEYINFISAYVGRENVYPMRIRNVGAVCLEN